MGSWDQNSELAAEWAPHEGFLSDVANTEVARKKPAGAQTTHSAYLLNAANFWPISEGQFSAVSAPISGSDDSFRSFFWDLQHRLVDFSKFGNVWQMIATVLWFFTKVDDC